MGCLRCCCAKCAEKIDLDREKTLGENASLRYTEVWKLADSRCDSYSPVEDGYPDKRGSLLICLRLCPTLHPEAVQLEGSTAL